MIGFFGGSFDPVHFGHLKNAQQLKRELNLADLFLMPCRKPVHKDSLKFSTKQRLDMLNIALTDFPSLNLDCREVNRESDSYSIESLKEITLEYPNETICLIIGMDSFNQLANWKEYQNFYHYCHLIVMMRPNCQNGEDYCNFSLTDKVSDLQERKSGLIYFANTDLLDISSSEIRDTLFNTSLKGKIHAEQSLDELLPADIINYIHAL